MIYTNRKITGWLSLLAIILSFPTLVQAEDYTFSIGQGFEFSSGKYGTSTRTDAIIAPFTLMANLTDRLGFALEIPYIYQSNGNTVSSIARGGTGSKTMMLPVIGMNGMSGSGSGTASSSGGMNGESGLGDITLKAGYVLVTEDGAVPQVRPMAFVKFPTADSSRSLGTGKFDEGFSVEFSKWLGKWNPFIEAGYTLQGKSSKFALRDYLGYNAGVGYQVTESFRPILLVKGTTPPADGASSLLEVRLKLKYQATNHTGMEGYLAKGLTTDSPDYGTGIAVFYDF